LVRDAKPKDRRIIAAGNDYPDLDLQSSKADILKVETFNLSPSIHRQVTEFQLAPRPKGVQSQSRYIKRRS